MKSNKVSKLGFYWIAFMSGIYTLLCCIKVVGGSYLFKDYRPHVTKTMILWSSQLLRLLKIKLDVEGLENLPKQGDRPVVVMCNHSSLYDIPVSAVALNTDIRMLAKRELFKIPIFSAALRRGEFLSIDRHNRDQARKDLEVAKQKMLDGIVLWVAPEGTRSKDGKLKPFKKGGFHVAMDCQALIVPVVIKNIHQVQAGDDLTLYSNQTVHVEVCEPIDTANYKREERRHLVTAVRNRMLESLGQSEQEKSDAASSTD